MGQHNAVREVLADQLADVPLGSLYAAWIWKFAAARRLSQAPAGWSAANGTQVVVTRPPHHAHGRYAAVYEGGESVSHALVSGVALSPEAAKDAHLFSQPSSTDRSSFLLRMTMLPWGGRALTLDPSVHI